MQSTSVNSVITIVMDVLKPKKRNFVVRPDPKPENQKKQNIPTHPSRKRRREENKNDTKEFELTKRIVNTLNENKVRLFRRIVSQVGTKQAESLLDETIEIEKSGGRKRPNGERKLPGGVFIQLLKESVSTELFKEIMSVEHDKEVRKKRAKRTHVRKIKRAETNLEQLMNDV
eukprot:TRINITY_DN780549_c0_g1_i1.p1 TRINITY_DN780549_c0_g1~~TRINITY_DN780549_c0_g1_i1.p1  ORF type:complete len:173 (-),score=29.23 TRINITY_DN780549_c0_g1_i1:111-629(-)